MGLTSADGSVRTQAAVQLAIATVAGAPDRVVAMSGPIRARMSAVRDCYAASMARSATVEGRAEYQVEVGARGVAKVKLVRDALGDPALVSCMKDALARTALLDVPRGSRAAVTLQLSNPLATMRRRLAETPSAQEVRMLAGGRAESAGGTDDLRFRVSGSAYAATTIEGVARGMATHVAGLLDCRRKAFRREREASGNIELALRLRRGELAQGAPRSTVKASASRCLSSVLDQLDTKSLADADLELAVSFVQKR
jgi:hypothetical protein